MLYKDLKDFLNRLTDEQLEQQVVAFRGDDEEPVMISYTDVSKEDWYVEHHGDDIGNLDAVKKQAEDEGENWEDVIEDLVKVPAGTVTLHSEI